MTLSEMNEWFEVFIPTPGITTVLCLPFTLLSSAKELIQKKNLPIAIGAQDVSPFGKGPYTGEVTADMIKEFASYVLVGHSERRQYFQESLEELSYETLQAKTAGLTVIYCVADEEEHIPKEADMVAFEPIGSIGTGNPEKPEIIQAKCEIFRKTSGKTILYGGSITEEIVRDILKTEAVDGLLVGQASLDPVQFTLIGKQLS